MTPTIDRLFKKRPTGMQLAVWRVLARSWPLIPTRRELLNQFPSLKTPSAVTKRLSNLRGRVHPEYLPMWDEALSRQPARRVLPLQGALLKNV